VQHPQDTVIKIIIIIMAPYIPGDQIGMKVGYSVEEGCRDPALLDERLPLLQHADLRDKVVLLRVDHNVVKKGTTRFRDR
jgi:phosphoglycerate kinase